MGGLSQRSCLKAGVGGGLTPKPVSSKLTRWELDTFSFLFPRELHAFPFLATWYALSPIPNAKRFFSLFKLGFQFGLILKIIIINCFQYLPHFWKCRALHVWLSTTHPCVCIIPYLVSIYFTPRRRCPFAGSCYDDLFSSLSRKVTG